LTFDKAFVTIFTLYHVLPYSTVPYITKVLLK